MSDWIPRRDDRGRVGIPAAMVEAGVTAPKHLRFSISVAVAGSPVLSAAHIRRLPKLAERILTLNAAAVPLPVIDLMQCCFQT
jgi:hypothetical protein